ncbi:major facilitator superfamily domain-containing protein [Talaromyces proteolyticus]|uniref:Major facilitator superfamily domain-containing protein n=1 Tax=Talaromyces proteolyticus TaxID=1131652 RepID=A0AAD4KIA5_9EURO|nr:major facilitator superfamily domain-containing protein [Talaromyces proteolyticus]KAH8689006.1 major facilitator superfamily domain-containing protein [Talaromyces proteolyticus]
MPPDIDTTKLTVQEHALPSLCESAPSSSVPGSPVSRPTKGLISSFSSSSTLANLETESCNRDVERKLTQTTDTSDQLNKEDEELGASASSKQIDQQPYHIFSRKRKKQMVYIVSFAALFSPLSSNIYFPALGDVSKKLNISMPLANLTITVYMIVQGIAPSFWGSLADSVGRRSVFMGTFVVYLIANIVLAFSNNYTQVMVFRAVQAAGSAATISIGAGVIGDLTTSDERGGLVGTFGGVRMLGQAIGPVFGGLLTQYCGYQSIFWFLTAFGGLSLVTIIFFLPETLRTIAGDGTVRLKGFHHQPIIYMLTGQPNVNKHSIPDGKRVGVKLLTIFEPLIFLAEKDVFITLFFGSIVYTVWSMVTSSTMSVFEHAYELDSLKVGLIFLANGAGCVSGSFLMGCLMDSDHRRYEMKYCKANGYPIETRINLRSYQDFPIEQARLYNNWWIVLIFVICIAGYGFTLEAPKSLMPLAILLQFFIAFTATAVFSANSALIIDLYPGKSASATAVNNLIRCSIGAAGVAVIEILIDALTAKYTFLLLACITVVTSPLLLLELMKGAEWRLARQARLTKK